MGCFQESDSSIEELADYTLPAKRPSKRSKRQQTQRKRRNADVSSGARHSDGSAVVPVSQGSAASNVTTEQSKKWSWINGRFQVVPLVSAQKFFNWYSEAAKT